MESRKRELSRYYALSALNRLLSRCLSRAARLRWCKPLEAARSILETAFRYAEVASSALFSETFFRNFLIAERRAERWLILWMRRFALCRARFLACGEFAKIFPLFGLNSLDAGISSIYPQKSRARTDFRGFSDRIMSIYVL